MANDETQIDGDALKAAVSSLTSSKSKNKTGISARKTTAKKTTTKKATAKKTADKKSLEKKSSEKKKSTAKKTTTKASTSSRKSSKSTNSGKSSGNATPRSRGLEADLKKNEDETYTRMELMDGIRLAVQEAGMEAVQKTLLAMVTDWTPILGEKLEKEAVNLIIRKTKSEYSKCTADQKKALRALVYWIRNDFDLGKRLAASELTSGFAGSMGTGSANATPLNLKPLNQK